MSTDANVGGDRDCNKAHKTEASRKNNIHKFIMSKSECIKYYEYHKKLSPSWYSLS